MTARLLAGQPFSRDQVQMGVPLWAMVLPTIVHCDPVRCMKSGLTPAWRYTTPLVHSFRRLRPPEAG